MNETSALNTSFANYYSIRTVDGPVIIACHWPELARRLQIAGGPVLIVEACSIIFKPKRLFLCHNIAGTIHIEH